MSSISKVNAVRQAVVAVMETPEDGVGFIKSNFGIDMTKMTWSSYRAQEKAQNNKKSGTGAKRGPKPKTAVKGTAQPA